MHIVCCRFAQFFLDPLFTESATERELNAVDSEYQKNRQSDTWRVMQLERLLSKPGHCYNKFSTGKYANTILVQYNAFSLLAIIACLRQWNSQFAIRGHLPLWFLSALSYLSCFSGIHSLVRALRGPVDDLPLS